MKNLLIVSLILIIALLVAERWGQRYAYIKTADIIFERCDSNDSQWCLTLGQYRGIIQQLAARENICNDKTY